MPTASIWPLPSSFLAPKPFITSFPQPTTTSFSCKKSFSRISASNSSNYITDFDLYDLLGVDSSSDESQIKKAYRSLQKRCHPDIAGPPGHDMSIILNQAYSVLTDPASRLAYDKEHAKMSEMSGYTGKPMYSVWLGSESEERAVFVDEVKCVGCLKCALFAEKTFAIESVYGRARVVAQWADPEQKIQAAIDICPVDCISYVERSDLAALEFLMSKQPRGNVRVGAGNTVGGRVSNIFVDVKKFQARFDNANRSSSKETDLQWKAKMSAIQAIRSITNWLYWQSPKAAEESPVKLIRIAQKSIDPDIRKLHEAAAARKRAMESGRRPFASSKTMHDDEYWVPSAHALSSSIDDSTSSKPTSTQAPKPEKVKGASEGAPRVVEDRMQRSPIRWDIPLIPAMVAAAIIQFQVGEGTAGGLDEHIGGSLALQVVNSSWLQLTLAGITWYLIGMAVTGLVQAIWTRRI